MIDRAGGPLQIGIDSFAAARARLAAALGSDRPAAFIEDAIGIVVAASVVVASG